VAAVLLVDDDDDMRAAMQDALEDLGFECVSARSLEDVQGKSAAARTCRLAILDINLGANQPTGVHVFHWLKDEGFVGRCVFLTGHAAGDPRVVEAARISAGIVSKPLELAELGRLVGAAP
jgi:DNA-binding NtrC family response regulator